MVCNELSIRKVFIIGRRSNKRIIGNDDICFTVLFARNSMDQKTLFLYIRQEDGQAGRRQSGDRQTDRQATDRQATSVLATGDLKIKLGFDCLCEVSLKSLSV